MKPPEARCPLCGSMNLEDFLVREAVPVHQNLLFETAAQAQSIARGRLSMALCRQCSFAHNRSFDASLLEYGAEYDNTQTYSPAFDEHVSGLIEQLTGKHGVKDCTIVEVGCGKGHFLRRLVEPAQWKNRGFGFDPAFEGPTVDCGGRLRFERRFYDQDCASIRADVVVCRHVIEHVPQPLELLTAVREALRESPQARVFFETPCLDWILRHQVIWDFFYEHCSLFTASSLAAAFERSGFDTTSVQHVFGGQYLWLEATVGEGKSQQPATDQLRDCARVFREVERSRIAAWRQTVCNLRRAGDVVLWGAGAKGVTFSNLVDPTGELIRCVVDVNPRKQGRHLPGTALPIVGPESLSGQPPATALVLNPNYVNEVTELAARLHLPLTVKNLMNETNEEALAA